MLVSFRVSPSSEIVLGEMVWCPACRMPRLDSENVLAKSADEIDAHIGGRVRLRRMMLNMSQEQLGNGLGLTFQQVQKYEKGLNRIGAGRLYHIAKLLAIEPAFFFQGLPEVADTEADPRVAHRQQEVSAFMASPDGYAIVMALSEITDSNVRRRILDLVRAVGGVDMPAEGH